MFRAPRGTADILAEEQRYWHYVREKAAAICRVFGYRRVDTPVIEDSRLFVRSIGEGTDIVEKEMYTFLDRAGDSLTLRPEGTAPVCRAYLQHGMFNLPQPVRVYYIAPIFRYERPQAGRYRQHHQFGVEAIGDGDPSIDVEVVQLGWQFIQSLGIRDSTLVVNSIGDKECRPNYLRELRAYYEGKEKEICDDCKKRLQHNTLRLLDCKQPTCQAIAKEAPKSVEHLCARCSAHWGRFLKYLALLGIGNRIDHRLVRGLDYYTRTVFEIQPAQEGSQSTILGGGRYDGLMEELGGKPTPGVGFGCGIERLVLNLTRQELAVQPDSPTPVVIVHTSDAALEKAVVMANQLRANGVATILAPAGKSLKAQMRYATSLGAKQVIILGEDELRDGMLSIKDMTTGSQQSVAQDKVLEALKA